MGAWSREPAPHRHTLCCFPLLGVEKAVHGSGKRALNLPRAITHRPTEVPLQRGSRGSAPSSLLQKCQRAAGKNHAAQKAPCSPTTAPQPVLNQSSRLLGPWAPTFLMQQAGDNHKELLENPESQECNSNPSQKPALPSAYFPSDMLDFYFFF